MRKSGLFTICGLFSTLLLLLPESHGSPVICSSHGEECEYNEDNYIDTELECTLVCEDQDQCQFITHQSLMINHTEADVNIIVQSSASCQLTVLAVGGGGDGDYGGGGSGYLQYQTIALDPGVNSISGRVGARKQASTVSINGVTTVSADSGQEPYVSGTHVHGGDGYSGGGEYAREGYFGSDGGSNGGDGEASHGGSGTGENISDYTFTAWTLTPGAGGKYDDFDTYGGGGGGVLVEGLGPAAFEVQGQGYGGGGGGLTNGLQGVILLEVRSE